EWLLRRLHVRIPRRATPADPRHPARPATRRTWHAAACAGTDRPGDRLLCPHLSREGIAPAGRGVLHARAPRRPAPVATPRGGLSWRGRSALSAIDRSPTRRGGTGRSL